MEEYEAFGGCLRSLIVALLSALATAPQDVDRLRTVLPNKAVVLVEKTKGEPLFSAQLFLSSRGSEETEGTNGYRHLLEHLIAVGPDGTLDVRLESDSLELIAQTLRDATVFEVRGPIAKLSTGLKALGQLARSPTLTQAQIDREAAIIDMEREFRSNASLLSDAAWRTAFGGAGADPFGTSDAMKTATPEALKRLHETMFVGQNAALVIAGDVDIDKATEQAAGVLALWPEGADAKSSPRPAAKGGTTAADAQGLSVSIPVASYREPSTAATLALALVLAADSEASFVSYVPSSEAALITVGSLDEASFDEALRSITVSDVYHRGRDLAAKWVTGQLSGPSNVAFWRGLLLVQSRDLRPETLLENVKNLTVAQIDDEVARLKSDAVVRVRGAK